MFGSHGHVCLHHLASLDVEVYASANMYRLRSGSKGYAKDWWFSDWLVPLVPCLCENMFFHVNCFLSIVLHKQIGKNLCQASWIAFHFMCHVQWFIQHHTPTQETIKGWQNNDKNDRWHRGFRQESPAGSLWLCLYFCGSLRGGKWWNNPGNVLRNVSPSW